MTSRLGSSVRLPLEAESRKADPVYAPLKELLSMMADSAQVASVARR